MFKKKSFPVRTMILCSLMIATQIVLARFVGIQVNEGIRISFETIPIVLGSFWLGPLWGMLIAALSDILGTLLSGYGVYFFPLTIGPVLLALIIGLFGKKYEDKGASDKKFFIRFIAVVVAAEIISSLYGTWALTLYYSIIVGKDKPFGVLLVARLAVKPVTIVIDTVLSYLLHRSIYGLVVSRYLSSSTDKQKRRGDLN